MNEEAIRHRIGGHFQRFIRTKGVFLAFHVVAISACCFSKVDAFACLLVWFAMQVGVHAGYHRYYSHASFKTYAWFEFALACMGCLAFQNGPLLWASKHRLHHRNADTEDDLHSPAHGFWNAHMGWLWRDHIDEIDWKLIPDLAKGIPWWIERYQQFIHVVYVAFVCLAFGPSGLLSFWVTPIVLCWHTTFATNSVGHLFGPRPFKCVPQSSCLARNNALLAVANLGEGWHNNHHSDPSCCHHGFYRWFQIDIIYMLLWILARVRVVWDLKGRRWTANVNPSEEIGK